MVGLPGKLKGLGQCLLAVLAVAAAGAPAPAARDRLVITAVINAVAEAFLAPLQRAGGGERPARTALALFAFLPMTNYP